MVQHVFERQSDVSTTDKPVSTDPLVSGSDLPSAQSAETRTADVRAGYVRAELVGMAAHDLRNPLTVILSLAELLQADPTLSAEERGEFVEMICRHAHDMRRLIDDLLDISRIDSGKVSLQLRPVHATELLEQVVQGLRPRAGQKKVVLETEIAPGVGEVSLDRERIGKVVCFLLDTALKLSQEGSTVKVVVVRDGDHVEFSVVDLGADSSSSELDGILDSGSYQLHEREANTGLALAISRRIVEMHSGTLVTENTGRVGGRTYFRIPIQQSDLPAAAGT